MITIFSLQDLSLLENNTYSGVMDTHVLPILLSAMLLCFVLQTWILKVRTIENINNVMKISQDDLTKTIKEAVSMEVQNIPTSAQLQKTLDELDKFQNFFVANMKNAPEMQRGNDGRRVNILSKVTTLRKMVSKLDTEIVRLRLRDKASNGTSLFEQFLWAALAILLLFGIIIIRDNLRARGKKRLERLIVTLTITCIVILAQIYLEKAFSSLFIIIPAFTVNSYVFCAIWIKLFKVEGLTSWTAVGIRVKYWANKLKKYINI